MEERLDGGCKKGVGRLSAATCRWISRIDSKIYNMKREKRKIPTHMRAKIILHNNTESSRDLVKFNIQTALSAIWVKFILYRVRDSCRMPFYISTIPAGAMI